jgi:CelD/BcsL family acetyltransferase involved in cellulose biosynthesis
MGKARVAADGKGPARGRSAAISVSGCRIVMATTAAELDEYAPAWDLLVEQAPARVHSITHAWITSFYRHFVGRDSVCRCVLAFEAERLVGVIPLVVSRKYASFLTKTEARPPANDQTFAADLVCRKEGADRIIDAMISGLDHFLKGEWELSFHHVSERSDVVRHFRGGFGRTLSFSEIDGYGNYVPIEGSFEDYLGSLDPDFARNLRRVGRKLERFSDYRVDFSKGDDPGGSRMARFLALEASGWKGQKGTAILCHPNEQAFYEEFARRLDSRGWLRWHELHADGGLLASQMDVRIGRVLYVWKIAHDERYRSFAPGNVLLMETIRRAFAEGDTDEVNCLTDSAWNRDWNMRRRAYYNVQVWPRRPLPFLAGYCRVRSKVFLRRVPFAKNFYHFMRGAAARLERRSPKTD